MVINLLVICFLFLVVSFTVIRYFLRSEEGEKEPKKALWIALGLGILSYLLVTVIYTFLKIDFNILTTTVDMTPVFVLTILVAAFIEEIFKFVPLALFIYKKEYFSEHTDGIIYFAIVGLTVGFIENLLYILLSETLSTGLILGLVRLIYFSIFHGTTTGIVGYFLAKQKVGDGSTWKTILALVTLSFIHGLSNLSSIGGNAVTFLIINSALVFGLFYFFKKAKKEDKALGISNDSTISTKPMSSGKGAILSLIIAILGLITSLFSIIGLAMGAVSLVLGFSNIKSKKRVIAIIGIILSFLALLIAWSLWIPPILDPEVTSLLLS